MKYLFVCTGNRDRSPLVEDFCRRKYGRLGHEFRSRGLEVIKPVYYWFNGRKSASLTPEDLDWADEVWVMTEGHRQMLSDKHHYKGKIVVLDINDDYDAAFKTDRRTLLKVLEKKIGLDGRGNLVLSVR